MPASMFTAAADAIATAAADLRKRAKMTQRQLSAALGREQNLVARIEQGQRRVDLIEWVQWCRACGADPEVEMIQLLKRIAHQIPQRRPRGRKPS